MYRSEVFKCLIVVIFCLIVADLASILFTMLTILGHCHTGPGTNWWTLVTLFPSWLQIVGGSHYEVIAKATFAQP